jgi:hypothetical protein
MRQSPLTPAFDRRTHASYEVRVRGTATPTFLWGSSLVTASKLTVTNPAFDKPLLLHIRNNLFGAVVTLSMQGSSGTQAIGQLNPGETITIPIPNMSSGVFATCTLQTTIDCLIDRPS